MIPFSFRQLEYLIAAIDHASIRGAADSLNVSQPTITSAIAKLEEHVGHDLLIRHHASGVSMAPHAAGFVATARELVATAQGVQQVTANAQLTRPVSLGCFTPLAPSYVPSLLSHIRETAPDLRIKVTEDSQDQIIASLLNGAHDFALVYDIDLPSELVKYDLKSVAPNVLLNAEHPLATQPSVTLSQLADDPFILLDIPPSRLYFQNILKSAGIKPNIAYRSSSIELVRGLVAQGLGYSLMVTRPAADVSYDGSPIAIRPITDTVPPSTITLCRRTEKHPPLSSQMFQKAVLAFFEWG